MDSKKQQAVQSTADGQLMKEDPKLSLPKSKNQQVIAGVGAVLVIIIAVLGISMLRPKAAAPSTIAKTDILQLTKHLSEAPILAQEVLAGTLPKVQDRMPQNPELVVPDERIGVYGGIWHLGAKAKSDQAIFERYIAYENLVRWNTNWTALVPNVAQSYEESKDATTYTFHLRAGMRWSDGQPFTADDILFWYNDIFLDKNLDPNPPVWLLSVDQKPVVVTKLDTNTVRFTFNKPNGQLLQSFAQVQGGEVTSYPMHYLKQFLPKYNPDIEKLVQATGVKDYVALFFSKSGKVGTPDDPSRWQHPEVPTLNAWMLTNSYDGVVNPVVASRNPYYWKIDTAGHQLPYIDTVQVTLADSPTITKMALAGKLDMQDRNVGNSTLAIAQSRQQLIDGQQAGRYHLFKTVFSTMNTIMVAFNMTDKNPILRSTFQNKNFRIGMSYAINRQKIINEVYGGHGEPWQGAPRPESPFYDPVLAKQYTEYDVAKANQYLDLAGLKKDAQGRRMQSDGTPLAFTMEWGDIGTLQHIQADWAAVGVTMSIGNTTDRTAFVARKTTNQSDVMTWSGEGGLDVIQDPRWYFPFNNESEYAEAWAATYATPNASFAETPPPIVQKQQDLYRQLIETPDLAKQNTLMKQILAIAKDQFYVLGIALPTDGFGIVNNNFHNVPPSMPSGWTYPTPAPTNTSQYFIQ
jgi:peptide/nickel transport system substrate-binding protein